MADNADIVVALNTRWSMPSKWVQASSKADWVAGWLTLLN